MHLWEERITDCFLEVSDAGIQEDQDNNAQDDSIPAEDPEIMLFDVGHQEPDDDKGNQECGHKGNGQDDPLGGTETAVFQKLQCAGTYHNRDGKVEGEFGSSLAGNAQQKGSQNGCTGTGGTGENGCEQLENTDEECGPETNVSDITDSGSPVTVNGLNEDKCDADDNQGNGNTHRTLEHILHIDLSIQEFSDYLLPENQGNSRNACHQNLEPEHPYVFLTVGQRTGFPDRAVIVPVTEGPDLLPEKDNDGENGAQLDHDFKHILKVIACIQTDHLIQEDQVPGRTDRKPFRDSFHNAEQNGFQYFYDC